MRTYYRPNLTPEQRDLMLSLAHEALKGLSYEDAQFEPLYRLTLRLKDCKEIGA